MAMNSDTGQMSDLTGLEGFKELAKDIQGKSQVIQEAEVALFAKQHGFDILLKLGDEIEYKGQALVLTYINVGKCRLTFTPKKFLQKEGAGG